jgi:enediyne biosynthesis protein E4
MAAVNAGFSQTVTFTKISTGPIATDQGVFAGAGWADFRSSGLLDLFICNYGGDRINRYYRNNGDGTFTKITQGGAVQDSSAHIVPAVGDYDNDGYPDLFISQTITSSTGVPNVLYHNNGDGTFTLAASSGVTNVTGDFNASSAVDYDNDGFVDFFVPGFNGGSGLLFHNNGNGTFSRPSSVINNILDNHSVAWADYDNDGFMDLVIPGDGNNFLYHNNGNGTFTAIHSNSVAQDVWSDNPWGVAWGDYDNDGRLDLFVTGLTTTNRLYHNNGNGSFTNVTSGPMLKAPSGGGYRACAWGDYDNDGYLDLFMCGYNATNALFHNNGDGTFTKVLSGAPVAEGKDGIYCNACGWADYDNDGFLDLLVTRAPADSSTTTNWLYHNNGNSNAWLEVKLIGTVANRSAIGAKVHVHATTGGKTFWQLREINSTDGRWIQPLVAHFGLGDATNVDTLRIEWPSGTVQEFQNVAARQILTYIEPPRLLATTTGSVPQFSLKGGRGLNYEVDSSPDLLAWSPIGTLTITNMNGIAQIVDTNPPALDQRFYRAVSH